MANKHILFVVELAYFVLFLPLLMMPWLGWAILIALSNYRSRLMDEIV
jgi:hypothetical protein